MDLYEDDLSSIDTPLDLLMSGRFSSISDFKLNFLANTIEASTSGEKPMSAASYKIMPLPHQILALDRVINRFKPRYLLADEVGLGKTIEAALIMEEFKFDDMFMNLISGRKRNDDDMEKLSSEIYQKAVAILENDEMLIPFSDNQGDSSIEYEDIKNIAGRVHSFTDLFFENRSGALKEYQEHKGLFYIENDFKADRFPRHFGKVIFKQNMGMEVEEATLLSFNHPFIRHALQHSKDRGKTASLTIHYDKFAGISGFLFVWNFTITNNFDMNQEMLIPVFITDDRKFSRRVSEYLKNLDKLKITSCSEKTASGIEEFYSVAESTVNGISENMFLEKESQWNLKVDDEYRKMNRYYEQRGDAVRQITIDNIREGKLKEMRKEQHKRAVDMKKRKQLFPDLVCTQIARVTFK